MLQTDSLRTDVRAVCSSGSYRMMYIRPTSEEGHAQMAEQAWLVSPLLSGLGPHSGNSWCTVTYTHTHTRTHTYTHARTCTHTHTHTYTHVHTRTHTRTHTGMSKSVSGTSLIAALNHDCVPVPSAVGRSPRGRWEQLHCQCTYTAVLQ